MSKSWFESHVAKPFTTGVTAFLPTKQGAAARREVRETYANFNANSHVPAPLKTAAEFLGPPPTWNDAALTLAVAGVSGGVLARSLGKGASVASFLGRAGRSAAAVGVVGAGVGAVQSFLPTPREPAYEPGPVVVPDYGNYVASALASPSSASRPVGVVPVVLAVSVLAVVLWRRP